MPAAPDTATPTITPGFAPAERRRAATLFWRAFEAKLTRLLAPEDKAIAFLARALRPDHALAARAADGRLLGLAGCKTARGGLFGGGMAELAAVYGPAGAVWRGAALGLTERRIAPGTLLMDGLFVAEEARGRGVGGALVDAIKDKARRDGMRSVRLDVADHNARARALYERHGFVARRATRAGPLHRGIGLAGSTEMRYDL
jgi:ribosomal protein S18 acetylase RimI-like enzyme